MLTPIVVIVAVIIAIAALKVIARRVRKKRHPLPLFLASTMIFPGTMYALSSAKLGGLEASTRHTLATWLFWILITFSLAAIVVISRGKPNRI